MFILYSQNGSN